jgi:hypothetical protein
MKKADKKEIDNRAYELWVEAGRPEGRDQEFYRHAERQLNGEFETMESTEKLD